MNQPSKNRLQNPLQWCNTYGIVIYLTLLKLKADLMLSLLFHQFQESQHYYYPTGDYMPPLSPQPEEMRRLGETQIYLGVNKATVNTSCQNMMQSEPIRSYVCKSRAGIFWFILMFAISSYWSICICPYFLLMYFHMLSRCHPTPLGLSQPSVWGCKRGGSIPGHPGFLCFFPSVFVWPQIP